MGLVIAEPYEHTSSWSTSSSEYFILSETFFKLLSNLINRKCINESWIELQQYLFSPIIRTLGITSRRWNRCASLSFWHLTSKKILQISHAYKNIPQAEVFVFPSKHFRAVLFPNAVFNRIPLNRQKIRMEQDWMTVHKNLDRTPKLMNVTSMHRWSIWFSSFTTDVYWHVLHFTVNGMMTTLCIYKQWSAIASIPHLSSGTYTMRLSW